MSEVLSSTSTTTTATCDHECVSEYNAVRDNQRMSMRIDLAVLSAVRE